MSQRKTRVRFAPSPTGTLHIGGVRTALYNYLFAHKNNGDFIIRIEDTDQQRFVEGAENYIMEALNWLGINPTESPVHGGPFGPYRQSERKEIYQKYAQQLIDSGNAYYAFDTAAELEEMRKRLVEAKSSNQQYNAATRMEMRNSLTLNVEEVNQLLEAHKPYVIRIKLPENENVHFTDIIRGDISVNTANMDDKVLFKSDGMPTYHLANVVDDYLMEISHVIRGEEWLPSAPLHVLLYRYLGWENKMPQFSHLPLILKPDGNGKLSKRDGDRLGFPVVPLDWTDPATGNITNGYREHGYLPKAVLNFLALLGWNDGTEKEVFSLEEMIASFSLERINKSGAKFDFEKAKWFNHHYLQLMSNDELAAELLPKFIANGYSATEEYILKIVGLLKERSNFTDDILKQSTFFFDAPAAYDDATLSKKWKPQFMEVFQGWKDTFTEMCDFTPSQIEVNSKMYLENREVGIGSVMQPFRILITGVSNGPSVFEICSIIGQSEVIARMEAGLNHIAKLEKV
jgi:glutamyl-tRNA synthetase